MSHLTVAIFSTATSDLYDMLPCSPSRAHTDLSQLIYHTVALSNTPSPSKHIHQFKMASGRLNLPKDSTPTPLNVSHVPFTSMPCDDPFKIPSAGHPSFLNKLKNSAPGPADLFTSKEVDSGIIYAETPSVPPSISAPSCGTIDSTNGVETPGSSIYQGAARGSIAETITAGATDVGQLMGLLTDNFRMTQVFAPKIALVFVGKYVLSLSLTVLIMLTIASSLPANMGDVELSWALSGMFPGAGVFVSRKVWHKPTALVQFQMFEEALAAVNSVHMLGGRVLRVGPSNHAF